MKGTTVHVFLFC